MLGNTLRPLSLSLLVLGWLSGWDLCATAQSEPACDLTFERQESDSNSSLRGLCVVDTNHVWTTGSQGTILRTDDGGDHWVSVPLPGRPDVEIRDVHAWDKDHAVVMIAGQPAEIWETDSGGAQWKRVFVDPRATAFYDDILLDPQGAGLAFGDVVSDAIPLVQRTTDGKWYLREDLSDLVGASYLHGYAASGTSMIQLPNRRWLIGTGGAATPGEDSVVLISEPGNWRRWEKVRCPILASESAGVFSLAHSGQHVVAVGGDYLAPAESNRVAAYSTDGGQSWHSASEFPNGFRSGVAVLPGDWSQPVFVCVGTNGTDLSVDGGKTWKVVNQKSLNAIRFAKSKREENAVGWAVGSDGAIYRIQVTLTPPGK